MNRVISLTIGAFALVFVGGGLVVPAVTNAQTAQEEVVNQVRTNLQEKVNAQKENAQKKRLEIQAEAEAKIKEAKENKELRTTEVRQKACESRASALANKMEKTSAAAERHVATIDKFNDKITAFVTKYSLDVTSYGELTTALTATEDTADEAVITLTALATEPIDCDNVDAAAAAAIAYQEALKDTRDAILAYRMATKDILVAVKTSAQAKESDSTTGTDSTTETETESETTDQPATDQPE